MLEKMRSTPVSELMHRDVKFIKEHVSLLDAVKKMQEFHVSSLIVESADRSEGYGIITRKDLINKVIDSEPGDQFVLVKDIMSRPIITVPPTMSVLASVKLMKRCNVRRVPVFDGREIVGILSNSDIFRKFYPAPGVD